MHKLFKQTAFKLFLIILAINLLQSFLSDLLNDEAYYWLYSRNLDWGYFDHPPMVALLVRIGSTLLGGDIGVRLLTCLMGSATFAMIYKLIEKEASGPLNSRLAILLVCSSVFLNLYSFMALPDTPLLFFAVLFLFCYNDYVKADTSLNALTLGLVAALLMYSKYHGVLLIGFTVLSNPALLKRPSFYAFAAIALLLFVPHLYWQYGHDYPTIRFQFLARAGGFQLQHIISYVSEQAGVTGPLVLLVCSILYKPQNTFQRALKFNVIGIFCFFLLSSFKESVNTHWTAVAIPSMLCLTYLYLVQLKRVPKFVYGLLIFNIILIAIIRINFIFDLFAIPNFNDHHPKEMAGIFRRNDGGRPLVFGNMYKEPAEYMFYSRQDAFAVENIDYKLTQFNYLPALQAKVQGKDVTFVTADSVNENSKRLTGKKGRRYFITPINGFVSYTGLWKVKAIDLKGLKASASSNIDVNVDKISNAAPALTSNDELILSLTQTETGERFYRSYDQPLKISAHQQLKFSFKAPDKTGKYRAVFSIRRKGMPFLEFNSLIYPVEVK